MVAVQRPAAKRGERVKVIDTVSFMMKGARGRDFGTSRACTSLFQRSLSHEERSDEQ